jgi:predicted XRE-type DNA-binding protein
MKHLIEIPLANGETVIVEVDGAETSAHPITPRRGVREFVEEQIVERVGQTFIDVLSPARRVGRRGLTQRKLSPGIPGRFNMSWRPKKLTAKQREERRLEAGQLLRTTDLSQAAIARIVGVSRTAVTKWKQQIKQRRQAERLAIARDSDRVESDRRQPDIR